MKLKPKTVLINVVLDHVFVTVFPTNQTRFTIFIDHHHAWPGNVRMLENAIVRSMIMQEKDGLLKHIIFEQDELNLGVPETAPENPLPSSPDPQYEGSLEVRVANYERHLIETALDTHQGNIAAAARSLNVSRTTLQYKVQKYAIRFGVVRN